MSRRLSSGLSMLMIALMLMACATPTPPLQTVPLPQELLRKCQDLAPLTDGKGGTVLKKMVEVSGQYYDCAAVHNNLVDALNDPQRLNPGLKTP